jgi:cell division protein FtsW (lipid II flippase)
VIGMYIFILWRGLSIASRASDLTGKLIASGISIWIALEAVINIGALINIAPFGGNALPLVSYGGSSMWATLIALGILMNISSASSSAKSEEGRNFGAVIDLRRRDRRRSVSRPRGS